MFALTNPIIAPSRPSRRAPKAPKRGVLQVVAHGGVPWVQGFG